MKYLLIASTFLLSFSTSFSQTYHPTKENIESRKIFQDNKFGMFIHWGASSVLGDGEWVMENKGIRKEEYQKLINIFNPIDFDAAKWVRIAKNAGMKYIVFITRHHDGFSNWDTKFSDWKITNTHYKKDPLKLLAAACKKQGIQLGLYYSTLDWYREDYPYETGRTGKKSGRTKASNYASYLQFMKNQLTELLTNYGPISCIWFDGHWDQTNPEGSKDRSSRVDWKYDEIYSLIHRLQPATMIGNNHHLDPIAGEDFQMFEQDLPGQNKSGLSFQEASALPLESCVTMNNSWGFRMTDQKYKTVKEIIHTLVGAAGRNSNLLLNVGPMPNGVIQKEFTDTLQEVGNWVKQFGHTIYGTRVGPLKATNWGVSTQKGNKVYLHFLTKPMLDKIFIPDIATHSKLVNETTGTKIAVEYINGGVQFSTNQFDWKWIDNIIRIEK